MDREYGDAHYITVEFIDIKAGCSGLELYQTAAGEKQLVAKVVFWDACGQFFFEAQKEELPLDILEELIAETKAKIRIR